MEVRGYFLKKQALHAKLSKRVEAASSSYSAGEYIYFYNISIWCLWLRIVRRSDQGV